MDRKSRTQSEIVEYFQCMGYEFGRKFYLPNGLIAGLDPMFFDRVVYWEGNDPVVANIIF